MGMPGHHHALEPEEMAELGITQLPFEAERLGLRWRGLPITDGEAPDGRFLTPWRVFSPELVCGLRNSHRVVVHCKGGLGRAGTVACLLLLDAGGGAYGGGCDVSRSQSAAGSH